VSKLKTKFFSKLGYYALLAGVLVTDHNTEQILLPPIAELVQKGGFFLDLA
jgi:hypothetical protein